MRIPLKDTLSRASIRKRLWIGAGATAVFIGTVLAVLCQTPVDPHDQGKVGLDFIAFYTAGNFVRDGKSADLYDIHKVQAFQSELARKNGVDLGSAVGPWWNPPFYAWVFVPIANCSYPDALRIWVLLNVLCAFIAAGVLASFVAKADKPVQLRCEIVSNPHGWKSWLLVPVSMALSTPFIYALSHGQNACTSLLLVTLAVVFWRRKNAIAAGLVTGLLFYKPQLGAVLAVMLVLSLGWRTLIGLSITGTLLFAASLALPGSIHDFLNQMPGNLHFVQCVVTYMWDRHVTFKAFWRLLLQGYAVGETKPIVTALAALCSAAVGAGLLWAALRIRSTSKLTSQTPASGRTASGADDAESAAARDRLIAATIVATPLLMPFYFDYDQLLLAIPAVLFAVDLLRRDRNVPRSFADQWLLRIWPVQYAWMIVNSEITAATHFNFGVVLLTAVAGLIIARAGEKRREIGARAEETTTPASVLAAA